ncbi:MAG TPA: bifunctional DNA-formamidopyrimidine glycosylase/DNA-(apurinic or apyrimidinic site) lyase [Pseudolabrys sp.]|nr:bifunctional DNA-formamidopyrimidine glycosylase/DNA-(apurinic or apyrimidinic site) lyase [Pseudolabrys sp.]
MPELPEVETVRRGLQPAMEGARVDKVEVRHRGLRWPIAGDFEKRLQGKTVEGLGRRAKYLLADLSSGDVLLMHLGMSGSFRVEQNRHSGARPSGREPGIQKHASNKHLDSGSGAYAPSRNDDEKTPGAYYHERSKSAAHDHVVFHMSNGAVVTFNDPRRFGSMKLVPRAKLDHEPLLRNLGPEPLGNEFDAAMLAKACAGKKTSLKAALSDQRVVAGLGNIYVCEALFRAHLSPKRSASSIADRNGRPNERAHALVEAIKAVLNDAIKAGGSSLRDHRRADGSLGDFQHHFLVYDREGERCPTRGCRGRIRRIVQTGRSTFYCPSCQK